MEKSSAENYVRLLEAVFLIQRLPAWGSTLRSRVARQPKTAASHQLTLERDDGHAIAFEIKAGSRIHGEDLRGLRALSNRLGERLLHGIVLYTGAHAYQHEERIAVLPLDRLWTSG